MSTYNSKKAMVPLPMLSQLVVACAAITTLLSIATQFLISYYLPLYFQAVKGVGPTTSGIYSFAAVGSTIAGTLMAGALCKFPAQHVEILRDFLSAISDLVVATKLGYYTPFSILGCALAAVGSGLLGTLEPASPAAHWVRSFHDLQDLFTSGRPFFCISCHIWF